MEAYATRHRSASLAHLVTAAVVRAKLTPARRGECISDVLASHSLAKTYTECVFAIDLLRDELCEPAAAEEMRATCHKLYPYADHLKPVA